MRATGASFLAIVIMAVLPQVMARFIGFSAYQLDSNLRNSALVGLVGGGGIGATLFTMLLQPSVLFDMTPLMYRSGYARKSQRGPRNRSRGTDRRER